jgi:cobyrinic acid a,c-diamide synthase
LAKAIIIAAPASGSGKTLYTLGLIRALKHKGLKVASAKLGPDYIDGRFHEAASAQPCINLDYWAMGYDVCGARLEEQTKDQDIVIIEGVMGLFDGPDGAKGSTADLAEKLRIPVILVIDAARQAQSIAALVHGFSSFRPGVNIAGVILNRVASDRHMSLLLRALGGTSTKVLGVMRQNDSHILQSRHLGLVQAMENQQLESFIETVAAGVSRETILDTLVESAVTFTNHFKIDAFELPPLAQNIAIASDESFAFVYPHILTDWRKAGASLSFFSPLNDECPKADAVFLPGGYPELHAGKLASNANFLNGLRGFKGLIYGECGGYMVLGKGLIDKNGEKHAMAGLLPLTTSFATRKLHLGYRQLIPLTGPFKAALRGHEFHYSTIEQEGSADALFFAQDAAGNDIGKIGQRVGHVMGSYAHIISEAP